MPVKDKPGKMGWWLNENESPMRTKAIERRFWDEFGSKNPARVARSEPKAADPLILTMVKEQQTKQNIGSGISLIALFLCILGQIPKWLAQIIGSCVASGGMRVCTIRSLWEIVVLGQPEETLGNNWTGVDNINHFAPYSYRAGRRLGGLNGGDGSFCGAHIKGLMEYGFLPCSTAGLASDAFPEPQSASLYRKWGNSNQLLEQFAPEGKKFDLLESERITSPEDLKEVTVVHFKPCMVCSDWAFKPDYQHRELLDEEGRPLWIYTRDRSNSWPHNMSLVAAIECNGKWFVIVFNSWGPNAHRNGHYFVVPLELVGDWIRDGAEIRTIGDLALRDSTLPIIW